jgi:hypothetical protein
MPLSALMAGRRRRSTPSTRSIWVTVPGAARQPVSSRPVASSRRSTSVPRSVARTVTTIRFVLEAWADPLNIGVAVVVFHSSRPLIRSYAARPSELVTTTICATRSTRKSPCARNSGGSAGAVTRGTGQRGRHRSSQSLSVLGRSAVRGPDWGARQAAKAATKSMLNMKRNRILAKRASGRKPYKLCQGWPKVAISAILDTAKVIPFDVFYVKCTGAQGLQSRFYGR